MTKLNYAENAIDISLYKWPTRALRAESAKLYDCKRSRQTFVNRLDWFIKYDKEPNLKKSAKCNVWIGS